MIIFASDQKSAVEVKISCGLILTSPSRSLLHSARHRQKYLRGFIDS